MDASPSLQGVERYLRSIQEMQTRAIEGQRGVLDQVAGCMVDAIRHDRRIFLFGTGHSHMLAEEAFFRAGGLAAAVPILVGNLMLHENPHLSSRLERAAGLADILLDQYHVREGEILFVYTNSGVNQMPVEMALKAKERHLTVVGVCSRAYARVAPLSALGKRLDEVADFTLDNCGVPGDGMIELDGAQGKVGPSSTVIGALIWNSLVTEVCCRLNAMGEELPVYISFNMPGGSQHNQALFEKWGWVNPLLKGWM
jgi:uncharacterized phosphosugar-binding protein